MQTAPAVSTPLVASRFYRGTAVLIAIILVAACALFIWPAGIFDWKIGLMCILASACGAALLWDAFGPVRGALHFAAGQWVLAQGDIEYAGTITPRLDLQNYLLVYFETGTRSSGTHKTAWLHLERQPARSNLGYTQDWVALRRAVFARQPVQTDAADQTDVAQPVLRAYEH